LGLIRIDVRGLTKSKGYTTTFLYSWHEKGGEGGREGGREREREREVSLNGKTWSNTTPSKIGMLKA